MLEFPDKFQIDTSAHMRAMRKRAKANYAQDNRRSTSTATGSTPPSGQATPEATLPPKGLARQDFPLALRQRRARGPKP